MGKEGSNLTPNTYLPAVMNKVRWSGILTGYHGIPACYNVVDRNCDLSTVHMHCVMCPPRGIYDKSIGLPLHELFPDDKQRDDQLRHMCTWHSGEVKRAYHQRGMFTRGCTDGVEGRTTVGPSGFRSDNVGCSCTRREHHDGILDDATLEKMVAALNRKKRDPDLFKPSAVCQRFASFGAADFSAADKERKALERAEECKRRCMEYTRMKSEAEANGEAKLPQPGGGLKPTRTSEPAEGRLPSVTESGEEAQTQGSECGDEVPDTSLAAVYTPEKIASKKSSGVVSKKSSGIVSKKSSGIVSKKSSGIVSKESSGIVSRKSSGVVSKKSSNAISNKSSGAGSHKPDEGAVVCFQETKTEHPQESLEIASERHPSRTSSKASRASPKSPQSEDAETDSVEPQSVGISAQDASLPGESRSGTSPCAPITLQCKCALYNKSAMAFPKPCPQATPGSQYGGEQSLAQTGQGGPGYSQAQQVQQYGAQAQVCGAQDQQCDSQFQQYGPKGRVPGQQYGSQSRLYGARVQLCITPSNQFAPQGQQYGPQSQQFGPQAPQVGSQGPQFGPQSPQGQQYGQRVLQNQLYGPQCQQYGPQGQQYGPQGQQFGPQGQQFGPQGQQFSPQGQQFSPQGQLAVPQAQNYGPQVPQISLQCQQISPQGQQFSSQGQHYGPQNQLGQTFGAQNQQYISQQGQQTGQQPGQFGCSCRCSAPRSAPISELQGVEQQQRKSGTSSANSQTSK